MAHLPPMIMIAICVIVDYTAWSIGGPFEAIVIDSGLVV